MPTTYNKVALDGTTLMDISDTTAVASDVAQNKYFYGADGVKTQGTATSTTPTGTININNDGTYDVTNYASADVAIDYASKVRAVTLVINREDTSSTFLLSVYSSFGTTTSFSNGIKAVNTSIISTIGESSHSATIHVPKSRPILILGAVTSVGNFDVTMDSAYGECIDVPHILGASNTAFTKAIYFTTSAPDQLTITITPYSQAAYPDTVFLNTLSATTNNTYTAPSGTAYSEVTVNVPPIAPSLQSKTKSYTPTETAQSETVTADSGYDGLSSVAISVGAISSTYVGSGITQRSSSDLTASGATVTAPAGYYASQATKSVTTMTLPTSAASSATSGYSSKATIGRSTSNQYINIPPGYNSAGGYYTISAVANGSATAPASISGTSATVTTGTNTLTLSKSVSVTPSVTAGYISSGTAGNSNVSLTASVTTQAAQTIHPSTSDQTIAASRYLTGVQTIKGVTVSGLSAANIASGVTVKIGDSTDDDCVTSVTGTLAFQTIYSGSSAPSSSTGVNGDIYIQTS